MGVRGPPARVEGEGGDAPALGHHQVLIDVSIQPAGIRAGIGSAIHAALFDVVAINLGRRHVPGIGPGHHIPVVGPGHMGVVPIEGRGDPEVVAVEGDTKMPSLPATPGNTAQATYMPVTGFLILDMARS